MTLQALVFGSPAEAAVGFGKSVLSGATKTRPTSLQFGPDGALYALYQDGTIIIYHIVRNGPNNYAVSSSNTVLLVKNIANHNDNGAVNNSISTTSCNSPCREATGLLVTGTAAAPVMYVSSSDPRYGGGSRGDTGLDTNSGIVSRLTLSGSTWVKKDLVRGLPRSEENHSINGMALDPATNTLYLGAAGNTNEGAPSNVFAYLPEYALSSAILSIDLNAIGNTTYDLPTLNDASRADDPNKPGWDVNDPFGGNNGMNQAVISPGGPVQVYASGFRNPFDVIFGTVGAHAGKLYAVDNGYNAGQGGTPVGAGTPGCTNGQNDTSPVTGYDGLHYVSGKGYYGGHPNPTRGNNANTFGGQSPVPAADVNPVECNFETSLGADPNPTRPAIGWDPSSTNGLTEYTASNFGGAMQGDLLTAEWDGYVQRFTLNAAGTAVTSSSTIFANVSQHPLSITALGDSGPFPGTVWVGDHTSGSIFVFEPDDGGGGGTCTGAYSTTLDEDGDGYTNADEIDNGTDPCSAADKPADWDGDHISDLNDPNDDNDATPDTSDPWAIDSANGSATLLPINHPFDDSSEPGGGLLNLGFTGLMTNGHTDYASLFDRTKLTAGGAGGVFTVDQVGPGDALGAANTQQYAFQYGFNLASANGAVFTPHTRVLSPFAGTSPTGTESIGLQLGTGDQDNYVKLVVSPAAGGQIQMLNEVGGSVVSTQSVSVPLSSMGAVDLYLAVDPATHNVQASYQVTTGGTTGARTNLGTPLALPSAWFSMPALASGVIATSGGAPTFPATWDLFEIQVSKYQPDARVKRLGAASYLGDNIYNATGTGQTASATTAKGTTKTFVVNMQNDGAATDGFRLTGAGDATGFTVRYFAGTTDITTAVVNGTWVQYNVAAGGSRSIQMRVTALAGAVSGSAKSTLLTAKSTHSATSVDAIKTMVTVG
jgi:hypothetical protein